MVPAVVRAALPGACLKQIFFNVNNCPPPPSPLRYRRQSACVTGRVMMSSTFQAIPVPQADEKFNPIQARSFYRLKVQWGTPLMISGTIKASPMKLCTVILLLKAYQNTERNFQNMTYDVTMTSYDVITEKNGKIRTSGKRDNLYIIRKVIIRALRKCNFD